MTLEPQGRPCVGCGYCCRKATCCRGQSTYGVGPGDPCPGLVERGGIFRCLLADQYHEDLAIGAGCCCPMFNEDRERVLRRAVEDDCHDPDACGICHRCQRRKATDCRCGPWRERELQGLAGQARVMVREDAKQCHDEGTCVLGAGIAVLAIPRRGRKVRQVMLTSAPFQGNVGSWKASQRALQWLKEQGVEAYWYDGIMD